MNGGSIPTHDIPMLWPFLHYIAIWLVFHAIMASNETNVIWYVVRPWRHVPTSSMNMDYHELIKIACWLIDWLTGGGLIHVHFVPGLIYTLYSFLQKYLSFINNRQGEMYIVCRNILISLVLKLFWLYPYMVGYIIMYDSISVSNVHSSVMTWLAYHRWLVIYSCTTGLVWAGLIILLWHDQLPIQC